MKGPHCLSDVNGRVPVCVCVDKGGLKIFFSSKKIKVDKLFT